MSAKQPLEFPLLYMVSVCVGVMKLKSLESKTASTGLTYFYGSSRGTNINGIISFDKFWL